MSRRDVDVLLFGSWAGGTAQPTSDLDLACRGAVSGGTRALLERRICELPSIRPVDLVDLSSATDDLVAEVERSGIPLSDLVIDHEQVG